MARAALITYEQVAEYARKMHAAGESPSARAILNLHGNGSLGTIQRHLKQWKDGIEVKSAIAPTLPAPLLRMVTDFVAQEVAAGRGAVEADLAACQSEMEDLIRENERQAATLVAQEEMIDEIQGNLSTALGRAGQLESDLATARQDASVEREEAGR